MSLNFGKLNFSVSFNPTSAFPLDARSYFESYVEASAAAAQATSAGNSDSVYYYGQTLVVVENNSANFYIIQPDNTLKEIEGATSIPVNKNLFEYDVDGNLSLKGFDSAALGNVFSVGPNGTIVWSSVYTKDQTDQQIRDAIAASTHLKRKIVDDITDIDINALDADQYIYMIPTGLLDDANRYYEYMVLVITDSEGTETRFIEQVGSWDVDLSNYATIIQLSTLESKVDKKVDAIEGSRLITDIEAKKLSELENSLIKSVDPNYFTVTDGSLNLSTLPINKIDQLDNILNNGSETSGGYYLINKDDKAKLDKLVINNVDGSLEISGTVNASNVQGLATWITEHSTGEDFVTGLSENNFTNEHLEKLNKAITEQTIETVSSDFSVTNKELNLNNISMSKIINLDLTLANKVNKDVFESLELKVDENANNITALQESLIWKELI